MQLLDLHTHTALCRHASGMPLDYVRAASQKNIKVMGCADHAPTPYDYDIYRMRKEEWTPYAESIREARVAGEKLGVQVLWGIEADWMHERNEETLALIHGNALDYVIGSVHYVNAIGFDDPANISLWKNPDTADQIWSTYIEQLMGLVHANIPNVIGHLDLPKKFGYYPSQLVMEKVMDGFHDFFNILAQNEVSIEINTSGWRKDVAEQYPSQQLLEMAYQAGVSLTLGSDAHAPDEVGYRFEDAVHLARKVGYDQLAYYVQRERRFLSFDS